MLTEYKEVICKMLGMEPAVWDAKHFTGQKRARNFWGNIPGMYSTAQYCRHLDRDKKDLDSALISNCNRKARVSHSRTITTSRNSLTVTNGFNDALVCMNGEEDHIWVQEVERLFGFPTHYTDVGYLTHERRRKLLGKSWSVPVIKHLLSPLKQYFKVKDKKEDVRNP
ncbi:DNA (cytosine-5)-methyltransferase 3B-like [Mercenaria mercenaria]|uniref:DNA (cytosine-5)-methyltransferase 3B-like n=1 Tax=Mercenaria mercenaria TaxID=6596 RepID=UPI00234E7003|nr:DNA (cytosine-5)-methyltransferase 3B-like [Mercenaria mercenaria]